MNVEQVQIDRAHARDLWRQYQSHQHYSTNEDNAIRIAYQRIAQGKVVIKALASIEAAGLNDAGLPSLALSRADQAFCECKVSRDGACVMEPDRFKRSPKNTRFAFPSNTFFADGARDPYTWHRAMVPLIPVHLRPKTGLKNYHVLWEAEWRKAVPVDPLLLRRIGDGDLWLVLAQWDLTEVERAALAHRVGGL